MSDDVTSDEGGQEVPEPIEAGDISHDPDVLQLPEGYACDRGFICSEAEDGRLTPLCGPIQATARACAADGTGWYLQLGFRSADGRWREAMVRSEDLVLAPTRVARILLGRGFEIRGTPKAVCKLLLQTQPDEIREALIATGWAGAGFNVYVQSDGDVLTFPAPDRNAPLFVGEPRHRMATLGRLETWYETVIGLSASAPVAVGACAAIAPAFLSYTGSPSFLLHLSRNDTAGAVCRAVANSVWGPPGGLEVSWHQPEKVILEEISRARDGLAILTGFERHHMRKAMAVSEALEAVDAAPGTPARVVVLSIGQPMADDTTKAKAPRHNLIELDASAWTVPDTGEVLHATASACGTFGPAAVQALMNYHHGNRGNLHNSLTIPGENLLNIVQRTRELASAEAQHAAMALGMLSGAGQFMARHKPSFPSPDKTLFEGLMRDWKTRNGGGLSEEDQALLEAVATSIRDQYPEFLSLLQDDILRADVAGWSDPEFIYLSARGMADLAETLRQPVDRITVLLLQQGLLRPGKERGYMYRMGSRIPGRPRSYRISMDLLRFAPAPGPVDEGVVAVQTAP